jgi:nucleoside-diphosphate-sugar epimerase
VSRILVTGASGFLGRNVIDAALEAGHEPVAWVHRESSAADFRARGIEVHFGDLGDADALRVPWRDVTAIVHLAAVVAPYSRTETFRVNVDSTRRLAERVGQWESPPVFLYVSSLSAAGPSEPGVAREEQDACRPRSLYGRSKLAAERALQDLAGRLPISVVRPPSAIGNWDSNLLQLFNMVRHGWNLVGISKQFQYSFVHAADVAQGILRAVAQGQRLRGADDADSQGIYYLADPRPITMVQLADMVAASLNQPRVRHVRIPRPICWGIAGLGDAGGRFLGMRTFLNLDKMREAAGGSWVCDTRRAQHELGFAVAAPLAERIRQTAAWYLDHGWLKHSCGRKNAATMEKVASH